jgi:hypothetical protein
MFSNVSPAWRRRLRVIVVAWALLLVAAAFLGRQATVREQSDAAEGRASVDATVGVAASALAGSAFKVAVGPPEVTACDITPVRQGVEYRRTFAVDAEEPELAFRQVVEALAPELGFDPPGAGGSGWRATSADFVTARLTVEEGGGDGPGLTGSVSTGCRAAGADVGAFMPGERPGWITLAKARPGLAAEGAVPVAYGRIECARGGDVETWWWDLGDDRLVSSTADRCR